MCTAHVKKKDNSIKNSHIKFQLNHKNSLMIGDSKEDLAAARVNKIDFFLIRNKFNMSICEKDCNFCFKNFLDK